MFLPTLKRVDFGDISVGRRDLVGGQVSGRGVIVSNHASTQTREFDRITVEGRGPPGWQLELYNNNVLISLGAIDDGGEYHFEDVVLNYGNNRIRVVMYGPQGQVREEVHEYQVAGSLLSPGQFEYRAGLVDSDRSLIQLKNLSSSTEPHITETAEMSYGLTNWLTLFGSYTRTPFKKQNERYYTTGLAFSSPVGVGEIERYRQIEGGSAVDLHFITQLAGIRLNTRTTFYSHLESPEVGSGTGARDFQQEVDASTHLDLPLLPMTLNVGLDHTEYVDGNVITNLDTSQSFTGGGVRFTHTTNSRFVGEKHDATTGGFNLSWQENNWQVQSGLSYRVHPIMELNTANAEIRYRTPDNFQAALNTQHNFTNSITQFGGQLGYDFKNILSTFDTQYRQDDGWRFVLRASTSLHPYTPHRDYTLSSGSKQNYAGVLGRVYLDNDGNGSFSDGDEPLEGVRLNIGNVHSQEASDKDGYVITTMQQDRVSDVSIDESTLKDPYYRPEKPGYSTLGLKGSMPGFDFPIIETGSIDGTVLRDPSGKPVSGMRIQLVDKDGNVYMTTETAFDGYYSFEYVVPGTYTVRADPSYQVNVPAETVTVSSEELYVYGIDLYLLEPAAEENAAEETDGASGGIAQLPTTAPAVSGTTRPAPASALDEGSSLVDGQPSDEDSAAAAESSADGGSSSIAESDSSGGASSVGLSVVKDVRVGESPDAVRLVLDLTGPASYDIKEGDGLIVLVDMPGTKWDTVPLHEFEYSKVLQSYYTQELPDKGTRVILKAQSGMAVKDHKLVSAADGKPDRLIIDLKNK